MQKFSFPIISKLGWFLSITIGIPDLPNKNYEFSANSSATVISVV